MTYNPYPQYAASPGTPLDPNQFPGQQIGPKGQYFGNQPNAHYDPKTDSYIKNTPKQPGLLTQITPTLAAGVGTGATLAGIHYLSNMGGSTAANAGAQAGAQTVGTVTPTAQSLGGPTIVGAANPTATLPGAAQTSSGLLGQAGASEPIAQGQTAFDGVTASGGPVTNAPAAAGHLGVLWGASTTPGATGSGWLGATGAPTGALGSAGAIAAGGATGYEQLKGLQDFTKGKDLPILEQAALALPTFGMSFLANPIEDALGIGHGQNYYDGLNRSTTLNNLTKGSGLLSFNNPDGTTYNLSANDYRKNPTTYNYDQSSPTMAQDIGAANPLAYLLGSGTDGKAYTDLAGALANAHKSGVSTDTLYNNFGLNHDKAYGQVILDQAAGKLTQQQADEMKNGLDQSFGVGAYAKK